MSRQVKQIDENHIEVDGLRFKGRRYIDAFPFAHHVDLDELRPDEVKVMRAMPTPGNLTVHTSNEHGVDTGKMTPEIRAVRHLTAHLYGQFRDGAEHWHTQKVD